jgi:membrane protein DedA with SNARE-associated domain
MDPLADIASVVAAYGLLGLCLMGLAERLLPVLPSYGLLLSVGMGAAEGVWSLPAAFLAITAGGALGCALCFFAVRALGDARSSRLINGAGRIFGISNVRMERWKASFRRNQSGLAFGLQLVPTLRLFAPAFAAVLGGSTRRFLLASTMGVAVWNGLFILAGFAASHLMSDLNTTVLTMGALGCLLSVEAGVLWIARSVRDRAGLRATQIATGARTPFA